MPKTLLGDALLSGLTATLTSTAALTLTVLAEGKGAASAAERDEPSALRRPRCSPPQGRPQPHRRRARHACGCNGLLGDRLRDGARVAAAAKRE